MLIVKLGGGLSNGKIHVNDYENGNAEQEVCAEGWNVTLSRLTCRQLGYR